MKKIFSKTFLLLLVVFGACRQENISPNPSNASTKLLASETGVTQTSLLNTAWTKKANFAARLRTGSFAFALEKQSLGFIGGGFSYINNTSTYYNDLWQYNPSTDVWTQMANMPGPGRADAVAFVIGNKTSVAYVGTGHTNISFASSDFYRYDVSTNTWQVRASLPIALTVASGFSIGIKGYIGIGDTNVGLNSTFWEYDQVADSWNQKADFGGGLRNQAIVFSVSGTGYIGGGLDNNSVTRQDFWAYDQGTDKWSVKNDLPVPGWGTGLAIGSYGYMAVNQQSFWKYFPLTDSWSQAADIGYSVDVFRSRSAFALNGKGYFGLGAKYVNGQPVYINDFWQYIPN